MLESAYGLAGDEIAAVVEQLRTVAELEVEQKDTVWLALADYRTSKADFARLFHRTPEPATRVRHHGHVRSGPEKVRHLRGVVEVQTEGVMGRVRRLVLLSSLAIHYLKYHK